MAKYGNKYRPEVAVRAMIRDQIPEEEQPNATSFRNFRADNKSTLEKEHIGRTIHTFDKFLESPPEGIIVDEDSKIVNENETLVCFCCKPVTDTGVEYFHRDVEVNIGTDATYGTNEQDLTLIEVSIVGIYEDQMHRCLRNAPIPIAFLLGTGKETKKQYQAIFRYVTKLIQTGLQEKHGV